MNARLLPTAASSTTIAATKALLFKQLLRLRGCLLVDISKLDLNSKIKKFSYPFIFGKGYSPLRGRIAFCLQADSSSFEELYFYTSSEYLYIRLLPLNAHFSPEMNSFYVCFKCTIHLFLLLFQISARKIHPYLSTFSLCLWMIYHFRQAT